MLRLTGPLKDTDSLTVTRHLGGKEPLASSFMKGKGIPVLKHHAMKTWGGGGRGEWRYSATQS